MPHTNLYRKIASSCPKWESVQHTHFFGGFEISSSSRPHGPRCDQCNHWNGGNCELFLAKGK